MKSKPGRTAKTPGPRRRRKTADANLDVSDTAPLTMGFFGAAVRNPFYRPVKRSTTVRIDADVLGWLKAQGPGYQTRINVLLRQAMQDKLRPVGASRGSLKGIKTVVPRDPDRA